MALLDSLVSLRAGALALCLFAASGVGAGTAWAASSVPLVLAQADPDAQPDDGSGGGSAALLIRIERLEDRLRSLTGQVEQLQFQNKRLDDQLRKMQQDVDFRFQDLSRAPAGAARPAPLKKSDAGDPAATIVAAPDLAPPDAPAVEAPRPVKHAGDAFDPNSNPDAPGAPKPLGTMPPSQPLPTGSIAAATPLAVTAAAVTTAAVAPPTLATAPHAPLDLTPNSLVTPQRAAVPPAQIQDAAITPDPGTRTILAPAPGAAGGSRTEYEDLFALYKTAQYDAAIDGFQNFVQKYPKDRLVPDATYYLGESFARQGRQREAAEQFLKLSTDYTKSTRAPDALLRLGVALNALGAKEQACATYQEVDHRYPTASSDVRAGVERELKRAKC